MERTADTPGPFLHRVKIRNYRSIGFCAVELSPLTFLVGRNGAGKSNFLDALHFVVDALRSSPDQAFRERGGIAEVRRISQGHPRNFLIELQLRLEPATWVTYGLEIAPAGQGAFVIQKERLQVCSSDKPSSMFLREGDHVSSSVKDLPPLATGRLFLANAAGLPEFRPAYDALLAMGFYNLNPNAMKELQSPDAGELLHEDGSNVASVVARLEDKQPQALERICEYLATIVPGITKVERKSLGPRETLRFYQSVKGSENPWKFYASNMSDGTLRALGAIVAVTQLVDHESPVRLVGIEEPETALHPAAAAALMDALREASRHTQILITSHSPDLLDQVGLDRDGLLVVVAEGGTTSIAPVDEASIEAIRKHLFTPGELLRMDQLAVDRAHLETQEQMDLYAEPVTVDPA